MQFMIGVASIVLIISFITLWIMVVKPFRDARYNIRQLSIYDRTSQLIFQAAEQYDIPMIDVVTALNAAVDTYNEGLRGKNNEPFMIDYFPLVRNTNEIGRQNNPKREESQGEE